MHDSATSHIAPKTVKVSVNLLQANRVNVLAIWLVEGIQHIQAQQLLLTWAIFGLNNIYFESK